jgi:tetratricopeptide (TPR) repeat protein
MRLRGRVAVGAIAATLAISALAVGSATRWTALAAALCGLGCGMIHIWSRRELRGWPPLLRLLGVAAAATAIQLVPLPAAVLGALSDKLDLIAANAGALGEATPSMSPITYDPASTWLELAKLVGYVGFAVACMRVAVSSRGRLLIASAIAAVGGAVAAVTLVHELAGAGSVFGLYTPRYATSPPLMGPFLNPNHLAGFLALTGPVAIGLALHHRGRQRLVWSGCAALAFAVGFLSESRTGAVSLLVGLGAIAGLAAPVLHARRQRRRRRQLSSNRAAIVVILATAIAAAVYFFGRGAIDELASTEVDELTGERGKVALWLEAGELIDDHPWTGVGRGAFEQAFASSETGLSFSHAENAYLQVVLDWGAIAALLLAILLALTIRAAVPRARESLIEAGLGAGLLAMLVHQLADFTLELPGAAYPTLAAFAVLSRVEISSARTRVRWRLAAVALGVAVVAVASSPLATPARTETDALAERFRDRDPRAALDPAMAAWKRHPGDFIAAAQVAESLFARGDRRAVAVINRALAINPAHPGLHLIAARLLLASQAPRQALVEYRAAIARATNRAAVIRELIAAFPDPEVAARGLPVDRRFARHTLAPLENFRAAQLGYHWTTRLVELHPDERRFHRSRASYALRTGRLDAAVESARIAAAAGAPDAVLLLARAHERRGEHAEVERVIAEMRHRAPVRQRSQILAESRLLARALGAQGKLTEAERTLYEAVAVAGADRPDAVPIYRDLAQIQEQLGDTAAAAANRARANAIGTNGVQ